MTLESDFKSATLGTLIEGQAAGVYDLLAIAGSGYITYLWLAPRDYQTGRTEYFEVIVDGTSKGFVKAVEIPDGVGNSNINCLIRFNSSFVVKSPTLGSYSACSALYVLD